MTVQTSPAVATPHIAPAIAISQRTRPTPFHDRVMAAGAKAFTVYNHMLLPTVFESVESDYWHLRTHVQVWDVSAERQIALHGPDALRLAQLMTPRDLTKLTIGRCMYAPLVDEDGGIVNDPIITRVDDDTVWVSIADSDVLLWAKGLARGFGLDVAISEPDVFPLAVQGPRADDLMARVFGEAVHDIRFYRWAHLEFEGHPMIVARSGWSRQGGFEIYVDRRDLAEPLWDALMDAGGDLFVRAGCPNLIERIESGLLSYGNDMTRETTIFEAGLDRFVNIDGDHDYLARDAIAAQRAAGTERMLRGIRFDADWVPGCITPWTVSAIAPPANDESDACRDGGAIGFITSAAHSPRLGCGVAAAMVDIAFAETGTPVIVTLPSGAVADGTVIDWPMA